MGDDLYGLWHVWHHCPETGRALAARRPSPTIT